MDLLRGELSELGGVDAGTVNLGRLETSEGHVGGVPERTPLLDPHQALRGLLFSCKINRRNKRSNPCIENWKNYDSVMLENHTLNVGCRAPYQLHLNLSIPLCRTREQMKLVKLGPDQNEEIGFQYPCRSVEKIEYSYVDHELDAGIWSGQGNFWIELSFTYQRFREITQSRYLKKNNS